MLGARLNVQKQGQQTKSESSPSPQPALGGVPRVVQVSYLTSHNPSNAMSGDESGDSPAGSPGGVDLDSSKESLTSYSNERRRSERVKREKPDYYDALDFEHKRTKSPGRGRRAEKGVYNTPGRSPKVEGRGRGRGHGSNSPSSSSGRAHLTWKKGTEEDEDDRERRRRKRPRHRENENEDFMMEDLTAEKILQCRVGLAEINRKLGVVMVQPS